MSKFFEKTKCRMYFKSISYNQYIPVTWKEDKWQLNSHLYLETGIQQLPVIYNETTVVCQSQGSPGAKCSPEDKGLLQNIKVKQQLAGRDVALYNIT